MRKIQASTSGARLALGSRSTALGTVQATGRIRSAASSEVREFLGALLRGGNPQRLLLVIIEVGGIARAAAFRRERRFDLAVVDGDPIGGSEPLVVLDVVHSVLEVAVALGEVHLEQVAQQILQVGAEV